MGYEVNLILLDKRDIQFTEGKHYGSVVASIDLCKIGEEVNNGIIEAEKTGVPIQFYLPGDGNKSVESDCYGKELVAIPVKVVLDLLNVDKERIKYRRYAMARPLLKEFMKRFPDTAYVVAYGH